MVRAWVIHALRRLSPPRGKDHSMDKATRTGRVLVVDDDDAMLRLCRRFLGDAGFEVVGATASAEGVKLADGSFDVVVTDIGMPDMDGVELLRRVRERDLDVPVILMTGNPTITSAVRALELGALRYFIKPFGMPEFI